MDSSPVFATAPAPGIGLADRPAISPSCKSSHHLSTLVIWEPANAVARIETSPTAHKSGSRVTLAPSSEGTRVADGHDGDGDGDGRLGLKLGLDQTPFLTLESPKLVGPTMLLGATPAATQAAG